MGFNTHSWNNPITLDANNLNRIEQGIKNSHDTIEILNEEVSNLQNRHADIVKDLNALTKDAPNIIETLTNISSLLKNNDISAVLSSADSFLMKTKQALTASELDQIYKNLHMDKFLKLTSVKVDGNNVVNGSEINIVLPKIDDTLDINSSNAISNKAVTKALSNINIEVDVPTHLSQLQQDKDHLTVSIAEKTKWDSYKDILDNIRIEETDPTVPAWAKEPIKPFYYYEEILNKPDIPSTEGFVQNTIKVAGIDLKDDITTVELSTALNLSQYENKVTSINGKTGDIIDLVEQIDLNNYLPLSAGSTKALTGDLYSEGSIILDNTKGISIKDYSGNPFNIFKLNANNQLIIGTSSKTYQIASYMSIRPSSGTSVNLGASNNQWTNIYGKTIYQGGKQVANKEDIPSVSGLASETYVNTQISALQGKLDSITNKADQSALDTTNANVSANTNAIENIETSLETLSNSLSSSLTTLQTAIANKFIIRRWA